MCVLQVQVKPDTQQHEAISGPLTAVLLPCNIFPHFDVPSYSSGVVNSSCMESVARKQKTVVTQETAFQLSYKLPKRARTAVKVYAQYHLNLGC